MMMSRLPILILTLIVIFCINNASAANISLVYSGNMDGELEPCGCSEGGDKGGIKRRANKIDQLREKNPNLILFSTGGLLVSDMPQDKLKSEYILKGLEQLNYDAIGVQWQDLAYGEDMLTHSHIEFIASNWNSDSFQKNKVVEKDSVKLAFFHWLDPDSNPNKAMGNSTTVNAKTDEVNQALRHSKKQGVTTVLSTTLPLEQIKKHFDLKYVDIVFIKAAYEIINDPVTDGKTLVLQPGSRGMRLGKLDLEIDAKGNINKWLHKVIPLPPVVGDAPRMASWYKEYNDKVRADYEKRVAARKALMSGKSPYAGEKTCESCHAKEHETWLDSPHSEAFFKLMDVGKSFDPNCIGCHTVGFEKEGGYLDYMLTKDLANVQCENCHGAARAHVESGGKQAVANKDWKPEQMCAQCHVQKHSPDFDFKTYWPRIKH